MSFDYNVYWRSNFAVPTFVLLFFLLCTIPLIKSFVSKVVKREPLTKESIIMLFMCVCFTFLIFSFSINSLKNGGIYLANEKESDAITQTCIIEEISEPSRLYPYFKYDHKYGSDITISGETYFAAETGNFKKGDSVIITYLPKSKVILSIYHEEKTQSN